MIGGFGTADFGLSNFWEKREEHAAISNVTFLLPPLPAIVFRRSFSDGNANIQYYTIFNQNAQPNAHTHRLADSNAYAEQDVEHNAYAHRLSHGNAYTERDTVFEQDAQPNTHTHRLTDSNAYAKQDAQHIAYAHRLSHGDAYTKRDTVFKQDAQPNAHTHRLTDSNAYAKQDAQHNAHADWLSSQDAVTKCVTDDKQDDPRLGIRNVNANANNQAVALDRKLSIIDTIADAEPNTKAFTNKTSYNSCINTCCRGREWGHFRK